MSKCKRGQTFPRPLSVCHEIIDLQGSPGLIWSVHRLQGKTSDNQALSEKGYFNLSNVFLETANSGCVADLLVNLFLTIFMYTDMRYVF